MPGRARAATETSISWEARQWAVGVAEGGAGDMYVYGGAYPGGGECTDGRAAKV